MVRREVSNVDDPGLELGARVKVRVRTRLRLRIRVRARARVGVRVRVRACQECNLHVAARGTQHTSMSLSWGEG